MQCIKVHIDQKHQLLIFNRAIQSSIKMISVTVGKDFQTQFKDPRKWVLPKSIVTVLGKEISVIIFSKWPHG